MKRIFIVSSVLLLALIAPHAASAATATAAAAPASGLSIDFNGTGLFTDRLMQIVALITILSVAPSILIMMTSFVRIVVVLSLLRTAMGLQQSPPNSVVVSLSLFLTLFVMTPTLTDAYHQGIEPLTQNKITTEQAFDRTMTPMKIFMAHHVRDADLKLFMDMAHAKPTKSPDQIAVTTLAPAFMLSELNARSKSDFCCSYHSSSSTWRLPRS